MITTQNIADAVGRPRMAKALDVGLTAVSNAATSGKFPARWLHVMEMLCADVGIECPPSLFGMKSTDGVRHVGGMPRVQVAGAK